MPALLYGIGAFALFAGLVMIGFGVPINEFSFGNTLIGAGVTAAVGGLIIIGLGAVAGQLRRLAETLAMQSARPAPPADAFETAGAPRPIPAQAPGRAAYPGRPKPDVHDAGPAQGAGKGADMSFEDKDESFAPTLRNPDESSVTVEDDVSLSPRHPLTPSAPTRDPGRETMSGWRSHPPPPSPPPQARPIPIANFDAMWPAQEKAPKNLGSDKTLGSDRTTGNEAPHDSRPDAAPNDATHARRDEHETQKPRAVAILKSGVVDGMGYTLYVDGSIEAELPQGTLRFASINELRSHLAKNA
jgi:hypothetical protein